MGEPDRKSNGAGMSEALRRTVYLVLIGLWSTGALWLVLHYFLTQQGEFGPAPNPFEHPMLAAHGFFAFATLWLFGLLWDRHIAVACDRGLRRSTGVVLVALAFILIASGYLLYYAGSDDVRAKVALIHEAVGLAALLPFLLHRFKKRTPHP